MKGKQLPMTPEELNRQRAMHLCEFDNIVQQLNFLEENLTPLLTETQKRWLARMREGMLSATTLASLKRRVRCAEELLGHLVMQHSIRGGYTYQGLSKVLGVPRERVRKIYMREYHCRTRLERRRRMGVLERRPWDFG